MFDAHSNFGYSTVAVAPVPANSGTSLQVAAGQGALFPAAPFNCTVWPSGVNPLSSNAEIVRVTAVVGDTFIIDRAQEGTAAVNIDAGFQIANTTSRKVFTDIEAACVIGAGTQTVTGPFVFVNGNGVTFGMDNGSISASVNPGGGGGVAISAGGNSQSTGTVVFSNSNGISFGLNGAGIMTAAHNAITQQSTQPVAASAANGSFLFSTLQFTNSNGISFSTSPGGIIFASHNALTSQSNQAVSASNGSFAFQTLSFTDAFNVTFGTSAGGIIFASVAAPGAASINLSAGTTSNNATQFVFANSNNVTFGLSSNTITASVNPGGGAAGMLFAWENIPYHPGASYTSTLDNGVGFGDYMMVPCNISFTGIRQTVSFAIDWRTSNPSKTNQMGISHSLGIYSRSVTDSAATNFSNSSVWVSMCSAVAFTTCFQSNSGVAHTITMAWNTNSTGGLTSVTFTTAGDAANNTSFAGTKICDAPFATSLPVGEYIIFQLCTSSSAGGGTNIIGDFCYQYSFSTGFSWAPFGMSFESRGQVIPNVFLLASTTNALPASFNSMDYTRSSVDWRVTARRYQFTA